MLLAMDKVPAPSNWTVTRVTKPQTPVRRCPLDPPLTFCEISLAMERVPVRVDVSIALTGPLTGQSPASQNLKRRHDGARSTLHSRCAKSHLPRKECLSELMSVRVDVSELMRAERLPVRVDARWRRAPFRGTESCRANGVCAGLFDRCHLEQQGTESRR